MHIFVSICFENFLVIMSTMVAIVKFENFLNFFNYFVSAVILPSNDSRTIFQKFNFVMRFFMPISESNKLYFRSINLIVDCFIKAQ